MAEQETSEFDQLFMEHHGHVYRTIYRIVGDVQESEDLVQEVFLRFHEALAEPAELQHKAWLTRVAINAALNAQRSKTRRQRRHHKAAEEAPVGEAPPPERPERSMTVRKIMMEDLSDKQSKLLMMYAAGLSYDEMAAEMDVKRASLSQLLLRAKRTFVQLYQKDPRR